jgi:hypothetical protein
MAALIFFLLNLGVSLFKPKSWLEAENAVLRQQLRRTLPRAGRSEIVSMVYQVGTVYAPLTVV